MARRHAVAPAVRGARMHVIFRESTSCSLSIVGFQGPMALMGAWAVHNIFGSRAKLRTSSPNSAKLC